MSRILSTLLLFVTLYHAGGFMVLFNYELRLVRSEVKRGIKEGVPMDARRSFRLREHGDDLEWVNDHEFQFEGMMYDVVERIDDNGDVILSCISDQQETALFASLDLITGKKANEKHHHKRDAGSSLNLFQYTCSTLSSVISSPEINEMSFSPGTTPYCLSGYLSESEQPPEFLC